MKKGTIHKEEDNCACFLTVLIIKTVVLVSYIYYVWTSMTEYSFEVRRDISLCVCVLTTINDDYRAEP